MISTKFHLTDSDVNTSNMLALDGNKLTRLIYQITLYPGNNYWKLDINFEILKFDSNHNLKNRELDRNRILFENGRISQGSWNSSDKLYITKLMGKEEKSYTYDYKPSSSIDLFFQYFPISKTLSVSYRLSSGVLFSTEFFMFSDFSIFLLAYSQKGKLDIMGELKLIDFFEIEEHESTFKVNNIRFRNGSTFDYASLSHGNFIIIPVSIDGSVSVRNYRWIIENNIPVPKKNKQGSLIVQRMSTQNTDYFIGYAYTVANNSSSESIVDLLIEKIIAYSQKYKKNITGITLPLLGCGSGGLIPDQAIDVILSAFRRESINLEVLLNIEDKNLFMQLKSVFKHECVLIPQQSEDHHPLIVTEFLRRTGHDGSEVAYETNLAGLVTSLTINRFISHSKDELKIFNDLISLTLSEGNLRDVDFLSSMNNLTSLCLSGSSFYDFSGIRSLTNLQYLDLSDTDFNSHEFLVNLTNLQSLYLRATGLYDIELPAQLQNLKNLDISNNHISDLSGLIVFEELLSLNIMCNRVSDISFVRKLPNLQHLNARENQIREIPFILNMKKLNYLIIDKNPLEKLYDLNLSDSYNHLITIRNYLLRKEEENKVSVKLPVKVLLLGNHSSGKSSLLYYIHNRVLAEVMPSTHVINISSYPKGDAIPRAIFYDFGGQDYYHGIYRAFLSGGSAYLLLYQRNNNVNQIRTDSHDILTQDFKLDYWLAQKQYLEKEKFYTDDPLFLIQTHAETDLKQFCDTSCHFGTTIQNDFLVSLRFGEITGNSYRSLKHRHSLDHLCASIDELIDQQQITRSEPAWYVDFLKHILSMSVQDGHIPRNPATDLLPFYLRDDDSSLSFMMDDLDQFHRQGLIIYYREQLPNKVWLNPVALTEYIHKEILSSESLKICGGKIQQVRMELFDPDIVNLLLLQKVIFFHSHGDEYIIPNFLPLAGNDDPDFIMMTFGLSQPLFVLKFKNFLPFGIINQIICSFGTLPRQKKFWRDQIVFALEENIKILIRIDFQLLEIKVFASFFDANETIDKKAVMKYIFYGLLATYWDFEILNFDQFELFRKGMLKTEDLDPEERIFNCIWQAESLYSNKECRPIDLFISLDDKYFVNYGNLCASENDIQIQVEVIDENRSFTDERKSVPIYQFQPFALKQLKNPKKAVISYSKKDLRFVEKFKQHILPLADEGLIENPWYCTELIAGSPWNDTIQQNFDNADIIFFMVSENLFSTPYIKEHEIKRAIERYERDNSLMIVPILLVHYRFSRTGRYDLSKFTGLPYTMMPIASFSDQSMAWYFVCEGIRIMIEQHIDPGSEAGRQTDHMIQFFKMVMDKRVDNIEI